MIANTCHDDCLKGGEYLAIFIYLAMLLVAFLGLLSDLGNGFFQ